MCAMKLAAPLDELEDENMFYLGMRLSWWRSLNEHVRILYMKDDKAHKGLDATRIGTFVPYMGMYWDGPPSQFFELCWHKGKMPNLVTTASLVKTPEFGEWIETNMVASSELVSKAKRDKIVAIHTEILATEN